MTFILLIMMLMLEVNLYIVTNFYLYNHHFDTMEQFETHTHTYWRKKMFYLVLERVHIKSNKHVLKLTSI